MRFLLLLWVLVPFSIRADDITCSGALVDSVENPSGAARLRHPSGTEEPVREGTVLVQGDTLDTAEDATVDLSLCDGSALRIGPRSEYLLDEISESSVVTDLIRGALRVRVAPPSGAATGSVRFLVRTPTGVIGVRGTEFVVEESEEGSRLYTLEGEVIFGGRDMAGEMRKPWKEIRTRLRQVGSGQESRISRDSGHPSPPRAFSRESLRGKPLFHREFRPKPASLFQRQREKLRGKILEMRTKERRGAGKTPPGETKSSRPGKGTLKEKASSKNAKPRGRSSGGGSGNSPPPPRASSDAFKTRSRVGKSPLQKPASPKNLQKISPPSRGENRPVLRQKTPAPQRQVQRPPKQQRSSPKNSGRPRAR